MNVEATARPNMPMQLTPLRGPEIGAFLTVSSGLSVFRSIGGGATDGQTVGPRQAASFLFSLGHLHSGHILAII